MDLITAVREGQAPSICPSFQSCLETNLSFLFFGQDRVYKFYKWRVPFFEFLNDPSSRVAFCREDFGWNQSLSPFIYLRLCPVRSHHGCWELCAESQAQDFYIEMRRVDETRNLTALLLAKKVSLVDIQNVARHLLQSLQKITHEKIKGLESLVQRGWWSLMQQRLVSLREYGESAAPRLEQKEHQTVMDHLQTFFSTHPYFSAVSRDPLTVAIDMHSDNVLLLERGVELIDIFLPKEEWRVVDAVFHVAQLPADIRALGSDEMAKIFYEASDLKTAPPPEVLLFYELSFAWIRAVYFSIMGKPELVKKYKKFVLENLHSL